MQNGKAWTGQLAQGSNGLYETYEKALALERKGAKIAKLNVGEPDWGPPLEAIRAAENAIAGGKTKYGSAQGELSLREKIAELHGGRAENIVITPGSKWGIYALMKTCLSRGDNVVAFSPHWSAYELMAKSFGAEFRAIGLEMGKKWATDLGGLENAVDAGTKLLVLNSPANPTSKAFSEKEENAVIGFAESRGITVIADDAYRGIAFEKMGERQFRNSGGVFVANTFSKTFGMTGWRIGYVVVPEAKAKELVSLNQITFTNVPVFIQACAEKAIEYGETAAREARKKCVLRAEAAAKILSGHLEFTRPDAGFYLFPRLPEGSDTLKFLDTMLGMGYAMVPGAAFGDFGRHFRMSLCLEKETIEAACGAVVETLEELE
ncbi:(5-formylfuran-3-yl)methyl phosphate transaminase [uncultured archaeon]|nr:(5-formylfuran-3-yl)methyl phosphate transaminase [uncultured archaeon]